MKIVLANNDDVQTIANIVSISNRDVAEQFGINKVNNPKHPSFYDEAWVLNDFQRGEEYFIYQLDGESVACVAYEQPNEKSAYLNRLSVLPNFRRRGIGQALVEHVIDYARSKGVSEVSIGTIAEHRRLNEWYLKLGFTENGVKCFDHLPFDVLFMKYDLSD